MSDEAPYAAPKSNLAMPEGIIFEGPFAKMKSPARLPLICVRCKGSEHLEQTKGEFTYINPVTFLWIVLSPLALILAYFIFRKKLSVEHSVCSSCAEHIKVWSLREKISWAVFFGSIVAGIFLPKPAMYILIPIFISFIFALFCATKKNTGLSVKKFQDGYFYVARAKLERKKSNNSLQARRP